MATASEEILRRYQQVETQVDAFDRTITVRRIRPSEHVALLRWAETDVDEAVSILTIAASVSRVDDALYTFPRSLTELNGVLDTLDVEGMRAAGAAYRRLHGLEKEAAKQTSTLEAAKN